jgi:hypothetical protein
MVRLQNLIKALRLMARRPRFTETWLITARRQIDNYLRSEVVPRSSLEALRDAIKIEANARRPGEVVFWDGVREYVASRLNQLAEP